MMSINYGDELMEKSSSYEIFRSPSAPPTAAGSFYGGGESLIAGERREVISEEVLNDPNYVNYYYSNVNLNPRLPPPLRSKEDWRFSRQCGGGLGGIGDRRKSMNNNNNNNDSNGRLSEFNGGSSYNNGVGNGNGVNGDQSEWNGVGLPGLGLGLGLGSREKSIAEIIQDDLNNSTTASRLPLRPASRSAFDENIATSEANYASALGASLSRSTTPDPQLVARAPSPRIPTAGEGRVNSMDKRSVNSPIALHGSSNGGGCAADLVGALSGMNLSVDPHMDHQNLFNVHGDYNRIKTNSQLNSIGSYTSNGNGMDQNYFMRSDGLVDHHKHGGPNSPSYFHSVGSPSSAIPNYSLSGHNINPALASMMVGQLGMDSRALDGGLSSRANIMAAQLENYSRGSHSPRNGLQLSRLDALYHHYMSSGDYAAAAQLAAFGDPSIDGDISGMDLLTLQKAYLGTLESGRPYLGKSAGMNPGYYGNSAFGMGAGYAGNRQANPLLHSSHMGPGSPLRHERNMRMPSGMRNLAAGMMGNWRSEVGAFMEQSFGSSLLDEFKGNKTRCFELAEIANHVVEFSADQYGSRFIQQKLETATSDEKDMVFHEIFPQALSLMTDVFGNYVVQKFFEHGSASQIRELADKLTGHVLTLSLQMYGCRVIQKAIEVVDLDQQKKMVVELDGHIMRCVRDQNGNHVIQKCIECIPEDAIQFIITIFYDQVVTLSTHPYGCRVIQRVLEHCHSATTQQIVMDEIMQSVCMLAQDQYGNYVVQHVLEHGRPDERTAIINKLTGKIVQMSQQKFASNVIEKCLAFGDATERCNIVNEMLGSSDDNEPLQVLMKDQFANYVVQKVLETCDDQQLEVILSRIKNHLNALKKYTYGKHIVARVEKLVAAGERRISLQNAYPASPVA
ncbi:pumilio homolog 1-like isoform X2 [Silene latifolia]|uniref:pumilio homolog 1-like isoform X2 n=1 Tax=Silene latifolia TaxID=37657 RepID=UPI003D787A91